MFWLLPSSRLCSQPGPLHDQANALKDKLLTPAYMHRDGPCCAVPGVTMIARLHAAHEASHLTQQHNSKQPAAGAASPMLCYQVH